MRPAAPGKAARRQRRAACSAACCAAIEHSLASALRHHRFVMLVLLGTVCLDIVLFVVIPKGFFPQQDTDDLLGIIQADERLVPANAQEARAGDRSRAARCWVRAWSASPDSAAGWRSAAERERATISFGLKPLPEGRDTAAQDHGTLP